MRRMRRRFLILCVAVFAGAVVAQTKPGTAPSTKPATKPATKSATTSTTKPTTKSAPARAVTVRPLPLAPPPQPKPPAPPPGPELWEQIAQRRDPELRRASLDRLGSMLSSSSPADQKLALKTLQQIAEIRVDRDAFASHIRALLASPDDEVRAAALQALPAYPMTQDDLAPIAAMAGDRSPRVRANVAAALVAANGRVGSAELDTAMLTLLDDIDLGVRRESMRAIANIDVSEAVENELIVLSFDPKLSRDAVVQGLSTRPIIDGAVARRLIDLLDDADQQNVNRAAWALRNATLQGTDRAELDGALLRTLDDSLNTSVRENCINALARSPDPAIYERLAEIARDPQETDRVREAALRTLR